MFTAIKGNLTKDAELRYTGDGKPVCNFTLAYTASKKDKQTNEWEDEGTAFVRVTVFDKGAENAANSLKKGMSAFAYGRFKNREWTDNEGNTRGSLELSADFFGPDLKNQTAVVEKSYGNNNNNAGGSTWNNAPANNPAYGF